MFYSTLALTRGQQGQPMVDPNATEKAKARAKRARSNAKATRKAAKAKEREERERVRQGRALRKEEKRLAKQAAACSEVVSETTTQSAETVANLLRLKEKMEAGNLRRYKDRNPGGRYTEEVKETLTVEEEFDLHQDGLLDYDQLSSTTAKEVERAWDWANNDNVCEVIRMRYAEFIEFERNFTNYLELYRSWGGYHVFIPAVQAALGNVTNVKTLLHLCDMFSDDGYTQERCLEIQHVKALSSFTIEEVETVLEGANYHYVPNTSVKNLKALIKVWKYAPEVPVRLALKLSRTRFDLRLLSCNYSETLQSYCGQHDGMETWATLINERSALSRKREECAQFFLSQGNPAFAVYKKYGVEGQLQNKLADWVRAQEYLPNLKVKVIKDLYTEFGDYYFDGIVRVAFVFGNNWKQWLAKQEKLNRGFHDSSFWLPMDQSFAEFAMKNGDRLIRDLQVIAGVWSDLTPDLKALGFKELLIECKSPQYVNAKHKGFACESGTWGVSVAKYYKYEEKFLKSLSKPNFHPEVQVELEGLKGRFLPREDVRGVYLGHHTNCCQHPGGVGSACAWYGQKKANSGFFVVEDGAGEIIAQSWTWETEEGICFDNVEAKGLGQRDTTVGQLYKMAAQQLVSSSPKVTIGRGLGDLHCIQSISIGGANIALPTDYNGYTDAGRQFLLAELV